MTLDDNDFHIEYVLCKYHYELTSTRAYISKELVELALFYKIYSKLITEYISINASVI